MAFYNRRNAKCPTCFSEERHRALQVFLKEWLAGRERPLRLLHQAPDWSLRQWLESEPGVVYVSGDLADIPVGVRYDLQWMPFRTESISVVIASHVLEHIENDHVAMSELLRILEPGGTAILLVPIDSSRTETYEDKTITTEAGRTAAYWQFDHVRLYGRDFVSRLVEAGFSVEMDQPSRRLPAALVRRYGLVVDPSLYLQYPLAPPDEIYIATRPVDGR